MINKIFTEYRISHIGQVIGGGTPSTSIDEYWNGNIPWISPKDLTNYNCVYISCGENYISEKGLNKSGTKLLPENTVLFSSRAPIGYVAIAANSICTNQGFKSIICDPDKVDYLYLYYYLKANLQYIKLFANGATFPELSGKAMKNIKINIFKDVKYQRKIADTIFKYDDLIENNNKRIKLLEQMAENLYKEWFVRFRFPGYENAEFENGIPKGWNYKTLRDILNFDRGISYSTKEIDCDDGLNLVNLKNIEGYGGYRRDGLKHYNGKYKEAQVVVKGDLIMGVTDMTQDRRTVGAVALIPKLQGINVISADLVKINTDISKVFLYSLCKFGFYSKYFSQFANGANVLHLKPNTLLNKKILLPTKNLINSYDKIVSKYIDLIDELNQANDNLVKQRDLLLPRLMSGKLEVE